MKKDKSWIIMVVSILFIILFAIVLGITIVKLKNNNNDNNNLDNNINVNTGFSEIKNYKLSKINQTLDIDDNITLKFIGTEVNNENYKYNYLMDIYFKGEKLNRNTIFNDDNIIILNSSKYIYLNVDKVKDVYIRSCINTGSQYNGNYVLLINDKGDVINNFNNVEFKYNKNTLEYEFIKNSGLEHYTNKKYKFDNKDPYTEIFYIVPFGKNDNLSVDYNLKIEFVGTEVEENKYNYDVIIRFNNKEISNNFNISNHEFTVEKINNYYIIKSDVYKTLNQENILLLTVNGSVINSYNNVTSEIDYENKKLLIQNCNNELSCTNIEEFDLSK